ncbi:hypothetical protein JOF56_008231 [Kibdelosporangium banguiense]|uniref:Uncharacterized protein n=1 Tax=Kibdelosporangium banguiense TaxID=1365924 RepID=A0ABS4TTW4_9PSEU|nr:hypothetical protein [Kibdelosporangium banguiense]MBP2327846.1 hypothetical protein [Kibdelosporangium banguiense]
MNKHRLVAPAAVGLVAAVAFGIWWFTTRHIAVPDVVEGWAVPNMTGTAISLHDSDDTRDGNGYIIAGAWWAGSDNMWHDGAQGPTCVGADTNTKTRVQLGIVDVEPREDVIGGPRVIWLRCLG